MLSVIDNAYLRKAQENTTFTIKHQKILFMLLYQKKYYEKGELLGLTNNSLEELDEILNDLEKIGIITIEGWLVKITDHTQLFGEEIEEKTRILAKGRKRI